MAQFDANVNLRVNVQEANKQLNKVERRLRQLERGTISRNKRNQGLASNLITGSKAAGANVGARLSKQNLDAQKKALRVADARVEKEIRLAAALQRQETILKALTRAGGTNSKAAQDRVDDALKASKEAKTNLGIQQAVNTLLEKELQIRREINRVANASNEAKSVGNKRGREIRGLKLPAEQEKRLLKLNAAYVTAAEKGQTDIAKAINRKVETELKGLRKIAATRKRDQKRVDADAIRGIRKRENEEKRAATKRQRDRSKLTDNIGAAAGFPLLFGGGAGSVVGGVAGAGIGSLFGAGFGVSILGSALGQAFDKLAAAALDTAKAFDNVADNLDVVLKKLGESNSTIGARASFLSGEGFTNQAAAAVQQRAVETLGNAEVQRKKELAKSARELDNALERLGLTFQGWITGPLKALADLISRTQPKPKPTAEQQATGNVALQESRIKVLEQAEKLAKARGGALSAAEQKRLQTYKAQLAVLKEQAVNVEGATKSERILLDLTRKRLQTLKDIGQAEVSVAERALTERRDVLAGDKGNIAVQKAQAEVTRLRGEIKANFENGGAGATARNLQLQKELNEALAKLGIARANASNNVVKAERQITKEVTAQIVQIGQLSSQSTKAQLTLNDLEKGTVENYAERIRFLTLNEESLIGIFETERRILQIQQEQERVGIREGELLSAILVKQQAQRQLLEDQQKLRLKQESTQQAARLDRREAIKDTRVIKTLEADINAERLKRSTDPNYMMSFSGAGLGFFSESAKLEADQIADRTSKLELYNEQLAKLQQRRDKAKGKVSGDKLFELDTEIKDLELLRNNFERLQPEIDAAALAQARFNDAFAAVSPAVNSLVGGLQEVVAGTKTAEEAFADFLKTVADMLIQTAATMIAQYIAIGIAKAFALGGNSAPLEKTKENFFGDWTQVFTRGYAEGGFVTGPTPAVVGEGGEPEYIIPASKMDGALARYSGGTRGEAVIDGPGSAEGGGGVALAEAPMSITIEGGVTTFGGDEFIRKDQLPSIINQAGKAGETRALRKLQMSPTARRRVGM